MLPEESATRKVEYTPEGVSVELRSPVSKRIGQAVSQGIAVAIAIWLIRAAWASLSRLTAGESLSFPFTLLERFGLSPNATRWILYAVLAIAGYTAVAGTYVILSRLTRRDRIVIRPGEWEVEHRTLGVPRREVIAIHESVALELDAFDAALVARTPDRKVKLSALGTKEDRAWLKSELDKKGTVKSVQNIATGGSRVIRTVRLEKRSDGSLFVTDTKAARYGCPVILLVIAIGLLVAALRFQSSGWWVAAGVASFITMLLWIGTGDRREAAVVRGSIHLRWVAFLGRRPGTARRGEKMIRSSILYLAARGSGFDVRTIDLEDGYPIEETLAVITGSESRPDAETILESIGEASGFPILGEQQAREWIQQKIDEYDAAYEDEELDEEGEEGPIIE